MHTRCSECNTGRNVWPCTRRLSCMNARPYFLSLSRHKKTSRTIDTSAVSVFWVETPWDCPGFVTAEVWANVCDFCKAWASGHIRACHMVLANGPHCPVCWELWRIKFSHLLSHWPPLINMLHSSSSRIFPHMAVSRVARMFFGRLCLFSFTFSWQSSRPTYSEAKQLTALIFAECRHHTLPVIKTFKDQSCGALTMAMTRTAFVCYVVTCCVKKCCVKESSLKSVTSARFGHVKRSPRWISENLSDKCQDLFQQDWL